VKETCTQSNGGKLTEFQIESTRIQKLHNLEILRDGFVRGLQSQDSARLVLAYVAGFISSSDSDLSNLIGEVLKRESEESKKKGFRF
jgi:hypothetical protein